MTTLEEKSEMLKNLFKAVTNSRSNITIHREVSAWTTAGLYFTFILTMYHIFSRNEELLCETKFKVIFAFVIGLFYIFFSIIIYSQYASHQYGRAINNTYYNFIFEMTKNYTDLKPNQWDKDQDKIFPEFIEIEIQNKNEELHQFIKIVPFACIVWPLIKKFKEKVKFSKVNQIESAIHSILLLHTIAFLIWVWIK